MPSMKLTTNTKGAAALLGAAFTYACFGLLIREMAKMFGNNAQVAFRFVLAFVFLGIFSLLVKRPTKLTGKTLLKVAFLGVAFCGVVILFTISANLTKLGNAVFLLYAGSIVTSLLIGTLMLKEKLTVTKVVAIVLALIGLSMYSSSLLALSLGVVTAILSGVLDGVSNSIRKTLRGIDRNSILLYQYAFGAVSALLVLAIAPQDSIRVVSIVPVIAGLVFAGAIIGLGNLLLYGFQHFDVNVGTVILATELFFASLIGWVFFREVPAPNEIMGGAVIFLASILSAVDMPALMRRLKLA
jgi:drug/metabolite transporter (DMT)-like permease